MTKKIGISLIIAVLLIFLFPLKVSAWEFKPIPLIPLFASPSPSPTPSPSPSPSPEITPSPSPGLTPTPGVVEEEEVIAPIEETPEPSPSPAPTPNIWQFSTIALGAAIIGAVLAWLILGRKKEKKEKPEEE